MASTQTAHFLCHSVTADRLDPTQPGWQHFQRATSRAATPHHFSLPCCDTCTGPCGDGFAGPQAGVGPFAEFAFGRLQAPTRYTAGQKITMKVFLTANHGGTFAFQLCNRTSGLDHACFNRFLTRADTGEKYWYLFSDSTGEMTVVSPLRYASRTVCKFVPVALVP